VRESAIRDKLLLNYGLARNRRSPKRPSEPRPSGVQPGRGQREEKDGVASHTAWAARRGFISRLEERCVIGRQSSRRHLTPEGSRDAAYFQHTTDGQVGVSYTDKQTTLVHP
jgi:hypothetical protein